jgi:hypothetical protein
MKKSYFLVLKKHCKNIFVRLLNTNHTTVQDDQADQDEDENDSDDKLDDQGVVKTFVFPLTSEDLKEISSEPNFFSAKLNIFSHHLIDNIQSTFSAPSCTFSKIVDCKTHCLSKSCDFKVFFEDLTKGIKAYTKPPRK